MRVLFTSPILEHPAAGGPLLRIENSIKALSKVCDLHVISRAKTDPLSANKTKNFITNYCNYYYDLGSECASQKYTGTYHFIGKVINKLFNTRIKYDAEFILDHVNSHNIGVLWFGYGNISYPLMKYINKVQPDLQIVCDTDSVWSRFVLRGQPYASGLRKIAITLSGQKKILEERAWAKMCDVTTAVSEVDAQYYRGLTKDKDKVHIFSNVIDIESYENKAEPPESFKNPSIYLAGTFGHYNSPMDSAARWFINEVFPKVLSRHPNLHFYIIGRESDKGFGHLNSPNITVTGKLESVLPYLCNTDIALVPLKFESGTRFKILEAGACKIPIVSTTLGAEGIPVITEKHILIADAPEEFADAIIKLLDDRPMANQLAENCYNLVKDRFSVAALENEAKNILEFMKNA